MRIGPSRRRVDVNQREFGRGKKALLRHQRVGSGIGHRTLYWAVSDAGVVPL